jgi:uroporphyrinogen decarboxylase
MNQKERVITALNHEEPDRVPVDCGGRNTTLMLEGYEKLKTKLGMEHLETEVMSKVWQTAYIHESIQEHFHGDCRHIRPINVTVPQNEANDVTENGEEIFVDQWGVKRRIENGYASISEYIMPEASMEVLANFSWPDPAKDMDYSQVKGEAKKLHDEGEYAIVGSMGTPGNLFEQCWCLRGMPQFFMDMAGNKEFAHALLRKIVDIRKENARIFLDEVGEYLDVFQLADDLAMQNGPFVSPAMYKEMIKPYQAELFQFVKERTNAKLYYHSCGAVTGLLDDFVEIGVDILNPVQVSATGMETDQLKKRFGKNLSFWGAIDTFDVLPNGSVRDVEKEVAKRIRDLAPGGGYILGSVHNMQSDVPPENVIAMYEAAQKFGKYPITC